MDVDNDDEYINAAPAHAAFVMTVSAARMHWLYYVMHSARDINIHKLHPLSEKNRLGLCRFCAQWNRLHRNSRVHSSIHLKSISVRIFQNESNDRSKKNQSRFQSRQELIRRWDSERELLYDDNIYGEASAYAHWTSTFYYKYLWYVGLIYANNQQSIHVHPSNPVITFIYHKKPSYRWGTARRGRASWNLVKFCTNVDDLYLKSSETRLLPIRL